MNGRTTRDVARTLQKICSVEFEADPDTEVGKVQQSHLDPRTWLFHVYVMRSGPEGRHVLRSNVIVVSPESSTVSGPDEISISAILKAPAA